MRIIFEQVIRRGGYDLAEMLRNIDLYHIEGKLTDEDREALYDLARGGAKPQYDLSAEIELTWEAIHEINDKISGEIDPPPEEEWPEWEQRQGAHDAYQVGDKVTYKGKRYICKMITTYAPDIYPDAWEEVA